MDFTGAEELHRFWRMFSGLRALLHIRGLLVFSLQSSESLQSPLSR